MANYRRTETVVDTVDLSTSTGDMRILTGDVTVTWFLGKGEDKWVIVDDLLGIMLEREYLRLKTPKDFFEQFAPKDSVWRSRG